jgi:hypothetical protein
MVEYPSLPRPEAGGDGGAEDEVETLRRELRDRSCGKIRPVNTIPHTSHLIIFIHDLQSD